MLELRESLQAQVAAIRAKAPNVQPDADVEELHELRIAVRRLRALLRAARPLLDDERAESLRRELGELGRELGPARDADVFAAYLRREAAAGLNEPGFDALLARLDAERTDAYAAARAALDDESFSRLLQELDAFCASVVIRDGSLDGLVGAAAKKLRKAMRDASGDEALHEARIKAKRVRYAAEAAGDDRLVKRAKRFQDVVGEHQDAVVAEERLRQLAEPETALLVGRLIERQAERRRQAREATPTTWKKLKQTL
jgi:CHAD domain-containing protein